jgi:hypothetical protein
VSLHLQGRQQCLQEFALADLQRTQVSPGPLPEAPQRVTLLLVVAVLAVNQRSRAQPVDARQARLNQAASGAQPVRAQPFDQTTASSL